MSIRYYKDTLLPMPAKTPGKTHEKNLTQAFGDFSKNHLLYGDCLETLCLMPNEVIDLIYLDPPFNSNVNYNMLFGSETAEDSAQVRAFADIWYWHARHDEVYEHLLAQGGSIGRAIEALYLLLGKCGMLAYLLFMTERLIQMHRILKQTGSLYLHCDPTASHYLKIILDAVFGAAMFKNEVVWRRSTAHNDAKRFGRISDRLLFYTKSDIYCWNSYDVRTLKTEDELKDIYPYQDERGFYRTENLTGPSHGLSQGHSQGKSAQAWKGYNIISKGRVWSAPKTGNYADYIEKHIIPNYRQIEDIHERLDKLDEYGMIVHPKKGFWPGLKKYADSDLGVAIQDIISEPIGFTNYSSSNSEYLGYPTQKPLGLLKKLILASSHKGDIVLDPFCGCGTTIDAAQSCDRRWVGMDVSVLAINVVRARLEDVHGREVMDQVSITGIPTSLEAARMLFAQNPFEFERWAVGLVHARPNDKQVGDKGSDGEITFPAKDKNRTHRGIVSVKGGEGVNPSMVRDLIGAVESMKAVMGLLILMTVPTKGMIEAAAKAGLWSDSFTDRSFPKIQIITIADLLKGHRPDMPTPMNPYNKASYSHHRQEELTV